MKTYKPVFEVKCEANWKTTCIQGHLYVTECRTCGTVLADGGTPKCMSSKILNDKRNVARGEKKVCNHELEIIQLGMSPNIYRCKHCWKDKSEW